MEYVIDFIDVDGDYDSVSVFVEDDSDEEEMLCELINSIISNKNIKEVAGIDIIKDRPFDDEEEDY